MQALYLCGGHVVLPDRVVPDGSVFMEDGRIAAVNAPRPEHVPALDVGGGYILPGFLDIHVHGGGGADCMDASVQAFHQIACAHAAHGTTALVATTMTCEDPLLERVIACYLEAERTQYTGAQLLGLHLEGPFFSAGSPHARGAQPVTRNRTPSREELERIIGLGQGRILRWDASPEIGNMPLFAQVMRENGILAAVAHTQADAQTAMAAYDCGFAHATHFYNAMSTFHKRNGRVYAGVIEATYLREDVTIELIADGKHVPRESMQLAWRIKGADRICLITDAMRASGTDQKRSVLGPREGGVPVVIHDGVAQLTDFSSYAGSIGTMDRALRVAHVQNGLPLTDVCRMLSLTPARLCGLSARKGSLEAGKDADIVVMTPDFRVSHVFLCGRRFEAAFPVREGEEMRGKEDETQERCKQR